MLRFGSRDTMIHCTNIISTAASLFSATVSNRKVLTITMFVKLLCGSVASHSMRYARKKSFVLSSAPGAVAKRWTSSSDRLKMALQELLELRKKKELADEENEVPPTMESIPADLRSIRDSIDRIEDGKLPLSLVVVRLEDIHTCLKESEKLRRLEFALKSPDLVKFQKNENFLVVTRNDSSGYSASALGEGAFHRMIKICLLAFWSRRAIKLPRNVYKFEDKASGSFKSPPDTDERSREEKEARRPFARVVADTMGKLLGDEVQVLDKDDGFMLSFEEEDGNIRGVDVCSPMLSSEEEDGNIRGWHVCSPMLSFEKEDGNIRGVDVCSPIK